MLSSEAGRSHMAEGILRQAAGDLFESARPIADPPAVIIEAPVAVAITDIIRSEHPDLPLVLLGHSWGSLIAQKIVNSSSEKYDAVVLSGTAYRRAG